MFEQFSDALDKLAASVSQVSKGMSKFPEILQPGQGNVPNGRCITISEFKKVEDGVLFVGDEVVLIREKTKYNHVLSAFSLTKMEDVFLWHVNGDWADLL